MSSVGNGIIFSLESLSKIQGGDTPPDISTVIRKDIGKSGYQTQFNTLWQFDVKQYITSYSIILDAIGVRDCNGDSVPAVFMWALGLVNDTVDPAQNPIESIGDLSADTYEESGIKNAPLYKGPLKKDTNLINYGSLIVSGTDNIGSDQRVRINLSNFSFDVQKGDRLVLITKGFTHWGKPMNTPTGNTFIRVFGEVKLWVGTKTEESIVM